MKKCPECGFDFTLTPVRVYHLTLYMRWPSVNDISNKGGGRWRYKKKRKEFEEHLLDALEQQTDIPPVKPKEWRRLRLTRHWAKGRRAYDRVNLAGGVKPLLDLFQEHGIIYDDAEKYCFDVYKQQKSITGDDFIAIVIEVFEDE